MKKTLVSLSFIFVFVMYSLYQYFGGSGTAATFVAANTSAPSIPVTLSKTSQPVVSAKKQVQTPSNPVVAQKGQYANGTYVGDIANAYYGYIQVQAIIQNGKLADVQFLQYPSDRSRSVSINTRAMPVLRSEAISAQSANVDIVSGATDSSLAFQQSLDSALTQAVNS
jgi:uncharacterized protein with FMN-binding domain